MIDTHLKHPPFLSWTTLVSVILTILVMGGGKSKRTYNFRPLAKTTEQLNTIFNSLDSIYQLEGLKECPGFQDYNILQQRQKDLCYQLQTFSGLKDGKKLIITFAQDCVVEHRKMVFRKRSSKELFVKKITLIDTTAKTLLNDANHYLRQIKSSCLREFNECWQSKKEEGNQRTLGYIKEMMATYMKPENQLWQDSVQLLKKLQTYKNNIQSILVNELYNNIFLAYVEELRHLVHHRENLRYCSNAHLRWTTVYEYYVRKDFSCERNHIEAVSTDKSWVNVVDSSWIALQYERSLSCVIDDHRKGCMSKSAINFDSLAQEPADICIGCMDPQAMNYCQSAIYQGSNPCIYLACTQWCYAESPLSLQDTLSMFPAFVSGRDKLKPDSSLCITNVCGCLDPCAASFDSVKVAQGIHQRNPQPDTCQIVCGCLDSLAVNYAKRGSPLWVKERYYRPEVTKHKQSVCIYTACKDSCALNFDPINNPKVIADASCICKKIDKLNLEQKIITSEWILADQNNSIENLTEEFFSQNPNLNNRNGKKNVVFTRNGNDLQILVDIKRMKVGNKETIAIKDNTKQIPLGEYNFVEVNNVIDALLAFLVQKAGALTGKTMNVFIVGEADANPIGAKGIEFHNAGRPVLDQLFRAIPPDTPTSSNDISCGDFDMSINHPPLTLKEGEIFTDNLTLAFLRAYIVKQKISDVLLNDIEEATYFIGAKPNLKKGGNYRKVTTLFTVLGFYLADQSPNQMSNDDRNYEVLIEAMDLFQKSGFPDGKFINGNPTGQMRYTKCPCYE